MITDYDLYLFGEGNHTRIHDKLGAHPMTIGSTEGVHFAVWAPNATRVSVVGDFNGWDGRVAPDASARRQRRVGDLRADGGDSGNRYKFELRTADGRDCRQGRSVRIRVRGAAAVGVDRLLARAYDWGDAEWMDRRVDAGSWFERPMAVYEVHLGSWARMPKEV